MKKFLLFISLILLFPNIVYADVKTGNITKSNEMKIYTDNNKVFGIKRQDNDEIIIQPEYKKIIRLGDSSFIVQKRNKFGLIDLNGNIKNKFEYKDVNYLANDINDSNGKILTLRYYTDDWKNEYVDAYDLSTGKKILQKYNDINTDDGKWFIAQKDGTLYLINSNGENIDGMK
ncbi:MAG: hypothetical protein BHW64_04315 [Candidatus Melainabacteria bacterium LEY3_CP_29_8]|nr:MAG: hypothetical protein BHW64_04315 [Candidatus Melainabacteria bacterium LEY3_CP_29_8]